MSTRKESVLGVMVDAVEIDQAVDEIIEAAETGRGLACSALAVHGLVLASRDAELRYRVNSLELVVPDGQPVRWALNWLHGMNLTERVFGPELMWRVCAEAEKRGLPIFLFGTREQELVMLEDRLLKSFPGLTIAGHRASRFRQATAPEAEEDAAAIVASKARIVMVGLGCPRQEIWAYENVEALGTPVLAVGAAFAYHTGKIKRAPAWVARSGLEWLFRLLQEPRRLWYRYLSTNPTFLIGVIRQKLGHAYDSRGSHPIQPLRPG